MRHITTVIGVLLIIVAVFFGLRIVNAEQKKQDNAIQSEYDIEKAEYKKQKKEEEDRLAYEIYYNELNGYEKLNESGSIDIIFVSDSDVGQDGRYEEYPSWQPMVVNKLADYHDGDINSYNAGLRGGSIQWIYSMMNTIVEEREYDYVVLNVGEHDHNQMSIETFVLYYEKVVYDFISLYGNAIVIPIYNIYSDYPVEYVTAMETVNDSYHLTSIDMSELQNDAISEALWNSMLFNVNGGTSVLSSLENASDDLMQIDIYNDKLEPDSSFGFVENGDISITDNVGSNQVFKTDKTYVYLIYVAHPEGAQIKIKVNDETFEVDTYSEVIGTRTVELSSGQLGEKEIKLEMFTDSSSPESLVLYGVASN